MPRDYLNQPINALRRSDRGIDDDDIRQMLHNAPWGAMAMSLDGQPFINTNLFVYDEAAHAIYLHTAHVGRTRATLEQNDRVCFSISEMGRLLPADEALEFSVEYAGVAVFGRCAVIDEPEAARDALQLLLDKYAPHLRPGEHYRPITDGELKQTAVYALHIDSWSGKRKQVTEDFPGAFTYPIDAAG